MVERIQPCLAARLPFHPRVAEIPQSPAHPQGSFTSKDMQDTTTTCHVMSCHVMSCHVIQDFWGAGVTTAWTLWPQGIVRPRHAPWETLVVVLIRPQQPLLRGWHPWCMATQLWPSWGLQETGRNQEWLHNHCPLKPEKTLFVCDVNLQDDPPPRLPHPPPPLGGIARGGGGSICMSQEK